MHPDLTLRNGKIYVGDLSKTASSLSIRSGRIAEIGKVTRGRTSQIIDLKGHTVLPGFIDSHTHFCNYGLNLSRVNLDGIASIEAALDEVRRFATHKKPGEWIRGIGWNQNLWERWPARQDLDRVAPANPVALIRKDFHLLWVNTRALEFSGWTKDVPDPPGGQIDRDPRTGELTGVIREKAMDQFLAHVPKPTQPEWIEGIRRATTNMHRFGITSVHTMEGLDEFRALSFLKQTGELGLRFYSLIAKGHLEDFIRQGLCTGSGDEFLRIGPVKVFLDGTLGSQTADMLEPFENSENRGIVFTEDDEVREVLEKAVAAGISVAMHAIGDRAVRRAINHFAEVSQLQRSHGWLEHLPRTAKWGRLAARHRIEHVQLIHPDDLPRLRPLNLIASVQPIHLISDMEIVQRHWGARSRYAYAFRTLKQHGMHLAFGSDCPVESPEVLPAIDAARNRQASHSQVLHAEERLTTKEAMQAYTLGGAYASGEEDIKGFIEAGKLADLVVLSEDPFQTSNLKNVEVVMTILDGKAVYSLLT